MRIPFFSKKKQNLKTDTVLDTPIEDIKLQECAVVTGAPEVENEPEPR